MSEAFIDLTNPAARRMIKLAKQRGFVTFDELKQVLPPERFSAEQIQDVREQLAEAGIALVKETPASE